MLENIKSPRDLDGLDKNEIKTVIADIREKITDTVSARGGHLASNLGMVEAIVALHRVFDFPNDTLIFDVGHQCYAHKLLTGRYDKFDSLRTYGGISGFTNKDESEYDTVTAGHSGSALSVGMGIAEANKLAGNDRCVVVVIGDGSFTNGMTFEALDALGDAEGIRLVVVLNDNEMSISKNVGGLSRHFSRVRAGRKYYDFKRSTEKFVGKKITSALKKIKDFAKRVAVGNTVFDSLGINFLGTVDGSDEERLEEVFAEAKRRATCCIIHMTTKKGSGYAFAENQPDAYHSVAPFDKSKGVVPESRGFSYEFGKYMCEIAENDASVCAVTAAMRDGTGLGGFAEKYPDRFFDVGIAEEHAAAFCSGLALGGKTPVCAVYSTFAQRIFDQLIHDVSLQRAHVIFALDRAGLVSGDGTTHHGIFDVSMACAVPGIEIYSPDGYAEMRECFERARASDKPVIVRYPKGTEQNYGRSVFSGGDVRSSCDGERETVIITYGRLTAAALEAAEKLGNAKVIKLVKIFPIDFESLEKMCKGAKRIFVVEEGYASGGIGEKIAAKISVSDVIAIDGFVPHGDLKSLDALLGLDANGIYEKIKKGSE